MTLRLRLVLALAGLVLAGLTLFGAATYSLYSRSQYQRLDEQIRASAPLLGRQLSEALGLTGKPERPHDHEGPSPSGREDRSPPLVPLATYAELRDSSNQVVQQKRLSDSTATPRLPDQLRAGTADHPRFRSGYRSRRSR